jgi:hypothetical protein
MPNFMKNKEINITFNDYTALVIFLTKPFSGVAEILSEEVRVWLRESDWPGGDEGEAAASG